MYSALTLLALSPSFAYSQEPCLTYESGEPLAQADIDDIRDVLNIALLPENGAPESNAPQELEACVNQLKNEIAKGKVFEIPDEIKLTQGLKQINDVILHGDVNANLYQRSSQHANQIEELELNRKLSAKTAKDEADANEKAVQVYTDARLRLDSDQYIAFPIELNLTADLVEGGKLVAIVEQKLNFDSKCVVHITSHSDTRFQTKGDQANAIQAKKAAGEDLQVSKKAFNASLLAGKLKFDEMLTTGKFSNHKGWDAFSDMESTQLHYEVRDVHSPVAKDKVFHRLSVSQEEKPVLNITVASSANADDIQFKMNFPAAPNLATQGESVSEEKWKNSKLALAQDETLVSEPFTIDEVYAPRMGMSIDAAQKLDFENNSAYGTWMTQPSNDGHFHYAFTGEVRDPRPILRQQDIAHYTQESAYYDYHSPEVAALIQKVRDKNAPGRREQVLEILSVLNDSVHYDFDMLKYGTVRPVKASQTAHEGKGVCQHFSALFVAIARGLGIPARVVEGAAIIVRKKDNPNQYGPGLHAWVEVSLDDRLWTPLDPQVRDQLSLTSRGYIPFGEMSIYENTVEGKDLNLEDALQAAGQRLSIHHLQK
jgi:transglutaminase-like putative cysteine protease